MASPPRRGPRSPRVEGLTPRTRERRSTARRAPDGPSAWYDLRVALTTADEPRPVPGTGGPLGRSARGGGAEGGASRRPRGAVGTAAAVAAALWVTSLGAPALASSPADVAAAPAPVGDATGEAVLQSLQAPDTTAPGVDALQPSALAATAVPRPITTYSGAPEPLARYVPQISCDPVARPGAIALRDLLKATYGGTLGGITRACSSSTSEHSEGRAYDWMLDADDAADAAKAAAMIQWLVGPDAQGVTAGNARRLGIMYIIWDRKIWGSYNGVWKTYTGASPHRDHVHFSLSWDGAMKRTSFWTGKTLTGHDYGPCQQYIGEAVPPYTVRNTSPCPAPVARPSVSAISAKWSSLGGEQGVLGRATTAEQSTPAPREGRYRHFERGSLYDSAATPPSLVRGTIRDRWGAMGFERSVLGFPVADERATPDGKGAYSHFQGGSIYSTAATGAHDVRGTIRDRWASIGWERSVLGYPTSDERPTPDGKGAYSHFQGGSIYATAATGAHVVRGTIRSRWAAMGWERSVLGYPTTDERPTPDGKGAYSHFQGGSIYSSASTGAHEVRGAIRDRWASMGWERSVLGYPTSATTPTSTGLVTHFQGGSIRWVSATKQTVVELG